LFHELAKHGLTFCYTVITTRQFLGDDVPVLGKQQRGNKTGVVRILVIFQHRHMLSYIDRKLSPRPFLNDMAEHWSILKTDHKTYYPRFSFTFKTNMKLPKTGDSFLLSTDQ